MPRAITHAEPSLTSVPSGASEMRLVSGPPVLVSLVSSIAQRRCLLVCRAVFRRRRLRRRLAVAAVPGRYESGGRWRVAGGDSEDWDSGSSLGVAGDSDWFRIRVRMRLGRGSGELFPGMLGIAPAPAKLQIDAHRHFEPHGFAAQSRDQLALLARRH